MKGPSSPTPSGCSKTAVQGGQEDAQGYQLELPGIQPMLVQMRSFRTVNLINVSRRRPQRDATDDAGYAHLEHIASHIARLGLASAGQS